MILRRTLALSLLCILLFSGNALAEDKKYNWIEGGKPVQLGKIASLDLGTDFVFLDSDNTKLMMTDSKDSPSGREIGSVYPKDPKQNWIVIFEYAESGHIKDEEKSKIDADAILKSYKKGTEESNKNRTKEEQLFVTGWDINPFYEDKTHNLTWSMLAEDAQKVPLLNYNVRYLTRTGYISAVLVSDPAHRDADRKVLTEQILPKLTPTQGQRYEDFNASTDKVSELGLTALILGGAGLVVAKKVGLIALIVLLAKKFWIVVVVLLGAGWKFAKGILNRRQQPNQQPPNIES